MEFKLKYYNFLPIGMYLTISYLCLTSRPFPSDMDFSFLFFTQIDKLVHTGLYFLTTKATLFQFLKTGKYGNKRLRIIWGLAVPISFGLMVELVQHFFIPGRSGDIEDFAANVAGTLLAYFTFKVISSRLSSK
ncbi:MAG: VanZ family protein [Bacteroidales bacterium]